MAIGGLTAGCRADGLRVWKSYVGNKTYFLYDGGEPVVEMNTNGVVLSPTVFAPDGLVARGTSSGWTQYTFDGEGAMPGVDPMQTVCLDASLDKKSAQGKFARRVAKIAKGHSFAKVGGSFQRPGGDVVQLLDWSRNTGRPGGAYELDLCLVVFAPEFHRRVYATDGDPLYHSHLQASLFELATGKKGTCWSLTQDQQVEPALVEMGQAFEQFAPPFYESFSSTEQVVGRYRNGGGFVRKTRELALWEAAVYVGEATRGERPGGAPFGGWPVQA